MLNSINKKIENINKQIEEIDEEELVLTNKVPKEKLILHGAIVNKNFKTVQNIVMFCDINMLYIKDKFGYNTMQFIKKHGTPEMKQLISKRVKDDLGYKLYT